MHPHQPQGARRERWSDAYARPAAQV